MGALGLEPRKEEIKKTLVEVDKDNSRKLSFEHVAKKNSAKVRHLLGNLIQIYVCQSILNRNLLSNKVITLRFASRSRRMN